MKNHRFGIGMSKKQAENFWRELVLMLIGLPLLIFISIILIDTFLKIIMGRDLEFIKYFLYAIGFIGWIIAIYRKYMQKILSKV